MRLDDRQPRPWPEGWRRLLAGVLLQAVRDAMGKGTYMEPGDREDATRWLAGETAQRIASELDLEDGLPRWLEGITGGMAWTH